MILWLLVERLKEFDQSTVASRKGSRAPTPPTSVKGIGGKGMFGSECWWISEAIG